MKKQSKRRKERKKMNELLEILKELRPDVDFATQEHLIDDGILDSFDIVTLVGDLNDSFDVDISAEDLEPENFNSAQAMLALIQRLQEE